MGLKKQPNKKKPDPVEEESNVEYDDLDLEDEEDDFDIDEDDVVEDEDEEPEEKPAKKAGKGSKAAKEEKPAKKAAPAKAGKGKKQEEFDEMDIEDIDDDDEADVKMSDLSEAGDFLPAIIDRINAFETSLTKMLKAGLSELGRVIDGNHSQSVLQVEKVFKQAKDIEAFLNLEFGYDEKNSHKTMLAEIHSAVEATALESEEEEKPAKKAAPAKAGKGKKTPPPEEEDEEEEPAEEKPAKKAGKASAPSYDLDVVKRVLAIINKQPKPVRFAGIVSALAPKLEKTEDEVAKLLTHIGYNPKEPVCPGEHVFETYVAKNGKGKK